MAKHLHENLVNTPESSLNVKDTVSLGSFNEYCDFRNELSKVKDEQKKLKQKLKGLPGKKIQKLIGESKFSFVDDGEVKFVDGNFSILFDLNDLDKGDNLLGIWYFVEGQGNMYVQPSEEDIFHNNAFSPKEIFPGEWSKDKVKKYLSFSKKVLHELENINLKIEDKSKSKLSKLLGKLFD